MAFNVPNADLLTGAAGKCNSGGGGDYFQPGMHKVQIVKTDVSPSTNPQESGCQIHIVEGLIVKGGEGTIRYDKDAAGMAIDLAVPRTLPAPAVGRKQASVNKSMPDVTRFQKNLGDFCLAAKQTFMNVVTAADTPEELTKYLTEIRDFKGPSLARVRAFIARGDLARCHRAGRHHRRAAAGPATGHGHGRRSDPVQDQDGAQRGQAVGHPQVAPGHGRRPVPHPRRRRLVHALAGIGGG